MIGDSKKQNVAEDSEQSFTPELLDQRRPVPPMRTFIVRQFYTDTGEIRERVITAHGFEFGESGMLAFTVFFYTNIGGEMKMVQAVKLAMASGTWLEVEEANLDFGGGAAAH